MNIAQLMTKSPKTCEAGESLHRAAQLMWEHDVGALPVVDASRQVIGMITDRDICMAAYTQGRPLGDLQVSTAMNRHVVTCSPQDDAVAVARLMAKHKVRRLPVVDEAHRPIGIVSVNDLALASARRDVSANELATTLASICEHRPERGRAMDVRNVKRPCAAPALAERPMHDRPPSIAAKTRVRRRRGGPSDARSASP